MNKNIQNNGMNKNIQENGMQRTLQDNGIDGRTVVFLADFVCGNGIGARSFINFGSAMMAST